MIYKYDNISEVLEGKQKGGGHSSAHIVVIATPRFLPWAWPGVYIGEFRSSIANNGITGVCGFVNRNYSLI